MRPTKIIAYALIAVGAIDLLVGNTDKQVLPDVLANQLTQQVDIVLVGLGLFILWKF
jgi:hypothetical protein